MALPGVTTILKDRFYSLSRTDTPESVRRVGIIARRLNNAGDVITGGVAPPDFDPFSATSEDQVINAYGDGSELHRGYLEALAGGAGAIVLIPLPANTADAALTTTTAGNPFDAAFDAVEAAQIDIVVPWGRGAQPSEWGATPTSGDLGFAADNSATAGTSLAVRVANKCKEITDRSYPCFAVMGVTPYSGTEQSMTPTEVKGHLDLAGLIDKDSLTTDNGGFVTVVATEVYPVGYDFDTYGYANGAATYAGFVSNLSQEEAPTAKRLFNVNGLRYNPTRPQQDTISGKGVVAIATDYNRIASIVDGVTFAKEGSDFSRLTTLRVVFATAQLVRRACRSFIGKPATQQHRNAMETAITNRLRALQIAGVLLGSDFTVQYLPAQNKALIELVLQPAFELRNIEVSIAVQI